MKSPFEWDPYSDQPRVIFNKAYKRSMRARHWPDYLRMAAISALVLPAATIHMALIKSKRNTENLRDLVGMGVSLDKGPEQFDLIDELGVNHIVLRIPLWDIAKLKAYYSFAKEFHRRQKTVLINILQDREHIESPAQLTNSVKAVFDNFGGVSQEYQIGNAINRIKWGFFSVSEYLKYFETVQTLRDKRYPSLKLLGPSVIDFEYHFACRALFNKSGIQFDRLSALLYVDRMGAPENKQYGVFDAALKMRLLGSLARMSPKVCNKGIYITEVNWPLSGTAPYAPTSEKECVSEEDYATYMQSYLKIAAQSGCIERVYWHQLIAAGYGLIDNRYGNLRKTKAFSVLRQILG